MDKNISLEILDTLFDNNTLSVHIVQGVPIVRKQGKPGDRQLETTESIRSAGDVDNFLKTCETIIQDEEYAFKEITRPSSHVRQIGMYRIVIVSPPVAPKREITIVRPLVRLDMKDYQLPDYIVSKLQQQGHGILIAGAPGEGKTTFAQALVGSLLDKNLIIKTIEAPRDVNLDGQVTQYGLAHTTHNEIRDILLLTRPDITLYDEVRNREDFLLYKDLRLAGVGLVGVMHATHGVDALQRCIGIIELGMIPQVIDTVLFIKAGAVNEVLTLKQVVKTPVGLQSDDLARPVLIIHSELEQKDKYEIYTYSDNVIVMPLSDVPTSNQAPPIYAFAKEGIEKKLRSELGISLSVTIKGPQSIDLYIPESETGRVIGKQGKRIEALQKFLGLSISVKSFDQLSQDSSLSLPHEVDIVKKGHKYHAICTLGSGHANQEITLLIGSKKYYLRTDQDGQILIRRKRIVDAIIEGNYTLMH